MQRALCVQGLAFGDESKGAVTDFLVREQEADLVVKFTGGPQASHTVVESDGRCHRFAQFGSGTFLPNCRTFISRHVLVEPFAMVNESEVLRVTRVPDAMDRMTVDPECVIISPWHWKANKIRELLRGDQRHGSCGMGIGETKRMLLEDGIGIRVGDLGRPAQGLLRKIRGAAFKSLPLFPRNASEEVWKLYVEMDQEDTDFVMDFYNDWARSITIGSLPLSDRPVIFEGAQGVLLDEKHGFAPHKTWANTTFGNALELCRESEFEPTKIGVLRTYMTRHGAGPFPSEDKALYFPDHNRENEWQGAFRHGSFDWSLARYAIECCGGVDEIALTHVDQLPDMLYPIVQEFPVTIVGRGPTAQGYSRINASKKVNSTYVEVSPSV